MTASRSIIVSTKLNQDKIQAYITPISPKAYEEITLTLIGE